MTTTSGTTAVPPTGSGRRRRWPWVLATLGVLGAAGYTALALSAGSTTPADTVVGGVQVGGLTHAEALAALRTGLQDKAAAPIPITFADQSIQLDPAVAGLDVDYVKSLDGLTGATFHPVALYERLTGALERDPALRIDTTALRQQLTLATQSIAIKPVNATLVFTDATAVLTPAVDGSTADIPGTMAALEGSWLKASPITGAVAVAEPDITTEEAQQARTELADTIVSVPSPSSVARRRPVSDWPVSTGLFACRWPTSRNGWHTPTWWCSAPARLGCCWMSRCWSEPVRTAPRTCPSSTWRCHTTSTRTWLACLGWTWSP